MMVQNYTVKTKMHLFRSAVTHLKGSQTLDMTGFAGFFYCVVGLMYRSLSQPKTGHFGSVFGYFRRDIGGMFDHYSERYTPMIALADATFEVKFKCV